jgi:hypothetical protein
VSPRRIVIAVGVAILSLVQLPNAAQARTRDATTPDTVLGCENGKVSKVWLSPLKIVNNCGRQSEQWVTVRLWNDSGGGPSTVSADIYSVQPGATYDSTTNQGDLAWHGGWEIGLTSQQSAGLDGGVFCDSGYQNLQPNVFYYEEQAFGTVVVFAADDFHSRTKIIDIYRKGSAWRANCEFVK